MNLFSLAVKNLFRDTRSGEITLMAVSIFISVSAYTSVGFFTDRVQQGMEQEATTLLAADLVVSSSEEIDPALLEKAADLNLMHSKTISFRSVIVADEQFQMAELKAVDESYPIRGELRTTTNLFSEEEIALNVPAVGTAWLDARLFQSLDINIGETINVGAAELTVEKILSYEPDRGGDIFNMAPRLLMNVDDIAETELVTTGSRVQYRLLLGGSTNNINAFQNYLETIASDSIRINTIREARPELKTALERAEQFLGLAVLVSIALAGLAIAMSSQRYCTRHYDHCAIMRCLGAEQSNIVLMYTIQLLLLSMICALFGCLSGYILQQGLSELMSGMVQGELPAPGIMPVYKGMLAGIITTLGFGLPHFIRLSRVSPMRVLRRHLVPMPNSSIMIFSISVLSLLALMPWQSGNVAITLYVFLGLLASALCLAIAAVVSLSIVKRFKDRFGLSVRYGLSNFVRNKTQSIAQIVSLGLGITIILVLTLVRTDLLDNWRDRIPAGTPNYFLINIQKEQVKDIKTFLYENLKMRAEFYPMIRGRLLQINERSVSANDYEDDRAKRLVSREFNLSFANQLQSDNRIKQGNWWDWDDEPGYFSVEEGIAESLGIKLNDELTYSIAGNEITAVVKNIRSVEWDSFNVNFFVIANPGTLDNFPGTYISSFYLPEENKLILNELLKSFPSVTVFDVDALLKQVRLISDQVIRAVEFVFIFTLVTGLLVLLSALGNSREQRIRETALFRVLGANQRQINIGMISELVCLGLVSGTLAAFSATLIEWTLATYVFQMSFELNPLVWLIAISIGVLLIVISGLLATRTVLLTPPVETLRRV